MNECKEPNLDTWKTGCCITFPVILMFVIIRRSCESWFYSSTSLRENFWREVAEAFFTTNSVIQKDTSKH